MLVAEAAAAVLATRDGDGDAVAERSQFVRKIMDVDSAVRAEVVIQNEEDVAHKTCAGE